MGSEGVVARGRSQTLVCAYALWLTLNAGELALPPQGHAARDRKPAMARAEVPSPMRRGLGLLARRRVPRQPLYVTIRPNRLLVPQVPERSDSSCTIWLWSTKRLTSGP